jgi:hypothetical protein
MDPPVRALYTILHGEPGADNTVLLDLRINSTLCCAVSDHGSGAGRRDDRLSEATQRERTAGTRVWCETVAAPAR